MPDASIHSLGSALPARRARAPRVLANPNDFGVANFVWNSQPVANRVQKSKVGVAVDWKEEENVERSTSNVQR
jgi:hypothetical protein